MLALQATYDRQQFNSEGLFVIWRSIILFIAMCVNKSWLVIGWDTFHTTGTFFSACDSFHELFQKPGASSHMLDL